MTQAETQPLRPLLKWPGGKRFLPSRLLPLLPSSFNSYYEPFLGSAALFFALRPARAYLSDTNEDLVNFYKVVRDRPSELIKYLSRLKNSRDDYYRLRESRPRSHAGRAARLMYLTNLSFNGIYRVNRAGEFNVPYGNRPHLPVLDSERLLAGSRVLGVSDINCLDFATALDQAKAQDLVYLDPPYTVAHGNNGFLRYNDRIFSWDDQGRLAHIAHELKQRSCFVLMTNADHPSIRKLYKGFSHLAVTRSSCMAASADRRGKVTELVITNFC